MQTGPRHEGVREAVPWLGQGHGGVCDVRVAGACVVGVEESGVGVGRGEVVLQVCQWWW